MIGVTGQYRREGGPVKQLATPGQNNRKELTPRLLFDRDSYLRPPERNRAAPGTHRTGIAETLGSINEQNTEVWYHRSNPDGRR